MCASTLSGGATAQANMSERGDDRTLAANPHICERTSSRFSFIWGRRLSECCFSRSDINFSTSQVVFPDYFYLCSKKQPPSENNVSLFSLVSVALSWALSAGACRLWLSSTPMRRVFLEKAAATPAFQMHSQHCLLRKAPSH